MKKTIRLPLTTAVTFENPEYPELRITGKAGPMSLAWVR